MARALLIVLDSVGCGGASDAAAYGDAGSDTLGHIAEACAEGRGDREGLRSGPLRLPNLARLGLAHACEASTGRPLAGVAKPSAPEGRWGYGVETSQGKDTPSGHWEIAGCPVPFRWGYFTNLDNAFPAELVAGIIKAGALPGILGNKHASGTAIIEELGPEHIRTGKPICYTSVDSVLQIAAHEEHFGLDRLYALCRTVRGLVDPLKIGRVIARPFIGSAETGFVRTGNRKDFAIPPPGETILDRLAKHGRPVVTVGKIGDIFAHRATGTEIKPFGNAATIRLATVLADLPLAVDRGDLDLDADDALQLRSDELVGRVANGPGYHALGLMAVGQPVDLRPNPLAVLDHAHPAPDLDDGVVPGRHHLAGLALGLIP